DAASLPRQGHDAGRPRTRALRGGRARLEHRRGLRAQPQTPAQAPRLRQRDPHRSRARLHRPLGSSDVLRTRLGILVTAALVVALTAVTVLADVLFERQQMAELEGLLERELT